MTFTKARRLARQGYSIRRLVWTGTGHERAWVSYRFGLYFYRTETAERVVEAADITVEDHRANDWTIQGYGDGDTLPVPEVPGDPGGYPEDPENPSSGGGFEDPNAGAGGGGGSPDEEPDSSGGGGGGGSGTGTGGGNSRPARQRKPGRTAPSLTVSVSRTSGDACSEEEEITDSFSVNITLGADSFAKPGELWVVSLRCANAVRYSGTLQAGDSAGTAFSITGAPGQVFAAQATAFLPLQGISTSGQGSASMRSKCGPTS